MEQHIPQDEIRRIIISDMMKKNKSIVPVIGVETVVYKDEGTGKENETLPSRGVYRCFLQENN